MLTIFAHILRNEKYTGKMIYGRGTKRNHRIFRDDAIVVPGAIPAIIPERIFMEVQKRLAVAPKVHTRTAYPYLLSGIAYCENGHKMIGYKKRVPYYYCRECHFLVNAEKAEKYVINYLKHIVLTKFDFEVLADEINKELQGRFNRENAELAYLVERKVKLQQELDRIVQAIKEGGPIKTLTEEAVRIEKEIDEINLRISEVPKMLRKVTPDELENRWENLKNALFSTDPLSKKEVIHDLVERVVLYKDGFIEVVLKRLN